MRRAPARRKSAASPPSRRSNCCAGLRGLNIVGADVVEVSPPFDPSGLTAYAGVTMMFEILCSMAEDVAKRR